ncbi:hypothetical protein C0Z17_27060 [Trinickia caryophylli]|nr:hypothetical protein C0Z17_27060 [Trinickia caryophylli]
MKLVKYACFAIVLLAQLPAHAASFDCRRGHSVAEKTICTHADLSTLDDELGDLFKRLRRQTSDRRALVADSDSKWVWREQNCTDHDCLLGWYRSRIAELRRQASELARKNDDPRRAPDRADDRSTDDRMPPVPHGRVTADARAPICTAADPLPPLPEPCDRVLGRKAEWDTSSDDQSKGWFCGLAMDVSPTRSSTE